MSDLDRRVLEEVVLATVTVQQIDKSEQQKEHPNWFMANGKMFKFVVSTDALEQLIRDEIRQRLSRQAGQ